MSNLGTLGGRPRRSSTNGVFGGFGAVPSEWQTDSRVKALQGALNAQMGGVGCTTMLKTDGLIGPLTCGALAWAKATGSPPAAYTAYASDMDAGCRPFTPKSPACPTAVVPSPQPSPVVAPSPLAPVAPSPALPGTPSASSPLGPPVPQIQAMPPPGPSGGPKMATIALIGGAVVAVGLLAFVLSGKKEKKAA